MYNKTIKSKYIPTNKEKYIGNPNNIICRSTWERKFCKWCDSDENILQWGSEEIRIRYYDPVRERYRYYYPDFIMVLKESTGQIKKYLIEIKPQKQTIEPTKKQRTTKKYINEVYTYVTNQAKWKAAEDFCKDNSLIFKILTEKDLGIKK